MENEIINTIINNGSAIALLCYFVYKDNKFTQTLNENMVSINNALTIIKEILQHEENKK